MLRWEAYDEVDMILLDIPLHIFYFRVVLPHLIEQDEEVGINPIHQHAEPVPRDPNDMVHAPVYRVGLSSEFHVFILAERRSLRNRIHPTDGTSRVLLRYNRKSCKTKRSKTAMLQTRSRYCEKF